MILSVSRRTDIPAFYMQWFANRLREGYVLVRNPMNPKKISRIPLTEEVLDGIVFWTKNPLPMMPYLDKLSRHPFYIQLTATSYSRDIEPNVPAKGEYIIPAARKIAAMFGTERIVWRYDPILISPKYTVDYHKKYFRRMAEAFCGVTDQCTISFLDNYRGTEKRVSPLGIRAPEMSEIDEILGSFSESASEAGIIVKTCSESADLEKYGVTHASCIDKARLERIIGCPLTLNPDKNQRQDCGCYESIDIGAYNSCLHGCLYCYANYIPSVIPKNMETHDLNSPVLFGEISESDTVTARPCRSLKAGQIGMI